MLATQAAYSQTVPRLERTNDFSIAQSLEPLSASQIRARARNITVKVLAGQGSGSGILIQNQGQRYTVLTNAHVLRLGTTYRIQTPDGKIYAAQQSGREFNDNDLAMLQFRSPNNYQIAILGNSAGLKVGEPVYASGFPADANTSQDSGFNFTTGQISELLGRSMRGGYQIGYSNDIAKGMSGGPVLNRYGQVIAINGKHKFPLWGNTYIFKDGSTPAAESRQTMDYSSWAIPMEAFFGRSPQFSEVAVNRQGIPLSAPPTNSSERPAAPEVPQVEGDPLPPSRVRQRLPQTRRQPLPAPEQSVPNSDRSQPDYDRHQLRSQQRRFNNNPRRAANCAWVASNCRNSPSQTPAASAYRPTENLPNRQPRGQRAW
ncbi:MAG: serine protease [Cyanosarcina radialis HA8281-LM2]|jgi:hypothetical protein|nr:serine protease [Cyanosarcina radialis HA8281-LM2]